MIEWLYTQDLNTQQPEKELEEKECKQEDLSLAKLWVLADKLLLPRLQNQVIEKMEEIRSVLKGIPTSCCVYVYNNTLPGTTLRRWLVHNSATNLDQQWFRANPDHFPKDMLMEMALFWRSWVLSRSEAQLNDWKKGLAISDYHVHVYEN